MTSEKKWQWAFGGVAFLFLALGLIQAYAPYISRHQDVAGIRASIVPVSGDEIVAKIKESKQPVVVYFYASWCSTCRAVTPHFANILREGEFKNARFMLVSIDTDELSLFDYLVRNRYDGLYTPYILNGASETLSGLGFTGAIPHIAFIDSKGRVAKQLTGPATRDEVLSSISVAIQ